MHTESIFMILLGAFFVWFILVNIYYSVHDRFENKSIERVKVMMHDDLKKAETARESAQKELQAATDKGNIIVNNACSKADEIINDAHAKYDKIAHTAELIKSEALRATPALAQMYADLEYLRDMSDAHHLDTKSPPAYKAAETVRMHAAEKKELRFQLKNIQYKLSVYESLLPWLSDLSDATTADLLSISSPDSDFLIDDPVHNYVSKEEWASLSTSERNQLALDRYNTSHQKTKWQIGRDYELYVGSIYQKKGYSVDYSGSRLRYDDLGRDLLVRKGLNTIIIQCKYWSKEKQIHEKHIFQLYGTSICYQIDHPRETVKCMLITNTEYTQTACAFAKKMDVTLVSNFPLGSFPQIKCNIGNSGEKIYHLPMDQQYDSVVISKPNEFFASTVAEAEQAGFRRAFKWHNS